MAGLLHLRWIPPQPLMSPSTSSRMTPNGNNKVFILRVLTICSASATPFARCSVITTRGRTYNACNCALSAPNTVVYSVINSFRSSLVTLRIGLLQSIRYPSTIFIVFVFFQVGGCSWVCSLLSWVTFVVWSVHYCGSTSPYMSYSMEISWPSSVSSVGVVVVCSIFSMAAASAVFYCVAASCS